MVVAPGHAPDGARPPEVGVGFLPEPIVHLHLTDLCNLACAHCYSSSAPRRQTRLDPAMTLTGLGRLRREGYRTVSLSGGEPLLYRGLPELVGRLREQGWRINLVTNGMVLRSRVARSVLRDVSFTVVSVDGVPARHDLLRGKAGAFAATARGIDSLQDSALPFGVTTTVTAVSLPEVPELHEWVRSTAATLLSLRPLAAVGRAREGLSPLALTASDLSRVHLLANVLDDDAGLRVRADVAPASLLDRLWPVAFPPWPDDGGRLADLVNPLIVTESGALMPYAYGIGEQLRLGSLADVPAAVRRVPALAEGLREVVDRARAALPESGVVDLASALVDASRQPAMA